MVFDALLTPFLRLPHFKGKTGIETLLRQLFWSPQRTAVFGGARMELDLADRPPWKGSVEIPEGNLWAR